MSRPEDRVPDQASDEDLIADLFDELLERVLDGEEPDLAAILPDRVDLRNRIEDTYELTYIRKDGSRFPAVVSVTALRDAQSAIIGYLLSALVERTGLTGTDRLLGAVFGAGRGVILVAMLVFLAALTPLQQDPWWKQSALVGRFQVLAEQLLGQIPSETVNKLKNLEALPKS